MVAGLVVFGGLGVVDGGVLVAFFDMMLGILRRTSSGACPKNRILLDEKYMK